MLDPTYIADQYGIQTQQGSDFHDLYTETLRLYHRRASGPLPLDTVTLMYALVGKVEPPKGSKIK